MVLACLSLGTWGLGMAFEIHKVSTNTCVRQCSVMLYARSLKQMIAVGVSTESPMGVFMNSGKDRLSIRISFAYM